MILFMKTSWLIILLFTTSVNADFSDFIAGGSENRARLEMALDIGAGYSYDLMENSRCDHSDPFSSDCDIFLENYKIYSSSLGKSSREFEIRNDVIQNLRKSRRVIWNNVNESIDQYPMFKSAFNSVNFKSKSDKFNVIYDIKKSIDKDKQAKKISIMFEKRRLKKLEDEQLENNKMIIYALLLAIGILFLGYKVVALIWVKK